jgi:hypothetical protein
MAQAQQRGTVAYTRMKSFKASRFRGVTSDYADFATFDAEQGRLMSTSEVERNYPWSCWAGM